MLFYATVFAILIQTSGSEQFYVHKPVIAMNVGIDGNAAFSKSTILYFSPPIPHYDLLQCKEIKHELELVDEQVKKLEKLFRGFKKIEEKFSERARKDKQEAIANYKLAAKKLKTDVDETLLEFQKKRLVELSNRIAIRTVGLPQFIWQNKKHLGLKLDKSKIRELGKLGKDSAVRYIEKCSEKCQQSLVKFADQLPDQTKQKVKESLDENNPYYILDLLADGIKRAKDSRAEHASRPSDKSEQLEEKLCKSACYTLAADGQWTLQEGENCLVSSLTFWLAEIKSNKFLNMELSDTQVDQINQLLEGISEKNVSLGREYSDLIREIGDTEEARAKLKEWNEDWDEAVSEELFGKILLPTQREFLLEGVIAIEARKLGPLGFVINSDLNGDEKKKVDKAIDDLESSIEQIRKQSIEREEELLSQMIKLLSLEDQEIVRKAIGKRPKHLEPSIFLMASAYGLKKLIR